MKKLLPLFLGYLLGALLMPVLLIVLARWQAHERAALDPYRCDGGNEGVTTTPPLKYVTPEWRWQPWTDNPPDYSERSMRE